MAWASDQRNRFRNARELQKLMQQEETPEVRVARLNLRGVSAMNRNELRTARGYFQSGFQNRS